MAKKAPKKPAKAKSKPVAKKPAAKPAARPMAKPAAPSMPTRPASLSAEQMALTAKNKELDSARARITALERELISAHKMRCPKCGARLVEEPYETILIDRCSSCNGIFFDAGEVDALLTKLGEKKEGIGNWFKNVFKKQPKAADEHHDDDE